MTDIVVFNCARDKEQIAAGTHFFCQAHQIAVPREQQSVDPRYCRDCYDFLLQEAALIPRNRSKSPKWLPITDVGITPQTAIETLPVPKIGVSKLHNGKTLILTTKGTREGIMKQRGRPKKEGEVSRVTQWRRSKGHATKDNSLLHKGAVNERRQE